MKATQKGGGEIGVVNVKHSFAALLRALFAGVMSHLSGHPADRSVKPEAVKLCFDS